MSRKSFRASRKASGLTPSFFGGVCGSVKERRQGAAPGQRAPAREEQAGRDPSDGAPDPDAPELLLGVLQVGHGDRVGQGEGGRIQQAVEEHQPHQRAVGGHPGHDQQDHPAGQLQSGDHLLGGEPAVGHLSPQEGGDDGGQREQGEDKTDLHPVEVQVVHQVDRQYGGPGPPDRVLEEHHHPEAGLGAHGRPPLRRCAGAPGPSGPGAAPGRTGSPCGRRGPPPGPGRRCRRARPLPGCSPTIP
jgi:hypothetical protein